MESEIAFIYAGGTIGARTEKYQGKLVRDLTVKKFMNYLTEKLPFLQNRQFKYEESANKFSESMLASDWVQLARSADKFIRCDVSGIVIFHGTDTMAYSSSALSYMLQGVKIPVVFTGSNYPLMKEDSDAIKNISDAVLVASQPNLKGVFLVFGDSVKKQSYIHLGTRVRKMLCNSGSFMSTNGKPIGIVRRRAITRKPYIQYTNKELLAQIVKLNTTKDYCLKDTVCNNVFLFKVHPSFNATQIRDCKASGIILELYASGTGCDRAPEQYSLAPNIRDQSASVFVISQHFGTIDMDIYQSSINIKNAGAIPLKDMTTEAALAKLIWVLGQTKVKEHITELMLRNLAGEISSPI